MQISGATDFRNTELFKPDDQMRVTGNEELFVVVVCLLLFILLPQHHMLNVGQNALLKSRKVVVERVKLDL